MGLGIGGQGVSHTIPFFFYASLCFGSSFSSFAGSKLGHSVFSFVLLGQRVSLVAFVTIGSLVSNSIATIKVFLPILL